MLEVVPQRVPGCQLVDSVLRQRPLHQRRHVLRAVAEGRQSVLDLHGVHDAPHDVGQDDAGVLSPVVRGVPAEQVGGLQVSVGAGLAGEGEDGGGRDDHTQPVRDDRVSTAVACRLVFLHVAGNGVGEAVAEMNSGIAEANASEGASEVHLGPGGEVLAVVDRPGEVLVDGLQGRHCPDV